MHWLKLLPDGSNHAKVVDLLQQINSYFSYIVMAENTAAGFTDLANADIIELIKEYKLTGGVGKRWSFIQ